MKGLFCHNCKDLVFFKYEIRYCQCQMAAGNYRSNGHEVNIWWDTEKNTISIVGVDNNLLNNQSLPEYHGKWDPDADTIFRRWGSAIVIVPPFTTNDVFRMEKPDLVST